MCVLVMMIIFDNMTEPFTQIVAMLHDMLIKFQKRQTHTMPLYYIPTRAKMSGDVLAMKKCSDASGKIWGSIGDTSANC